MGVWYQISKSSVFLMCFGISYRTRNRIFNLCRLKNGQGHVHEGSGVGVQVRLFIRVSLQGLYGRVSLQGWFWDDLSKFELWPCSFFIGDPTRLPNHRGAGTVISTRKSRALNEQVRCMMIEKKSVGMYSRCDYPYKSCLCTFWPCHPYFILQFYSIAFLYL